MLYYVEDDEHIRDLAIYALRQAGFETIGFAHANDFFKECSVALPDAVLLDIMLPDIDGLEILRRLREDTRTHSIPVMMLTAKGTEIDTVSGLDAGADDYLAKPFGMMELVSRVRALLRRASSSSAANINIMSNAGIELDLSAHTVKVCETPVQLTLKEFELLHALMANVGNVLSRVQLLERVWGTSFMGSSRTVDVHIQTLRQKLGAVCSDAENSIETVRGVGYRMRREGDSS
ncbi:response regulator transcription factor [Adlercreutzia sp. ZJ304]|uniref:response regulator transcription factor n=1 Tax=Adlercreutzia sp. ZJ304 TaxID=2709791 RepID=UPI0013ED5CD6|nr:response regulator transcription factor [Adlercreutzia sp. ZJ304]